MRRKGFWNFTIIAVLFGIFAVSTAYSQTKPPVVLERADVLKNKVLGEESVKELIGNVRITRGDMVIDCDYAVHYQKAERIVFQKKVHYSDSLRDMWE